MLVPTGELPDLSALQPGVMALETKLQLEVFGQAQLRLCQQEQMVLATIQFLFQRVKSNLLPNSLQNLKMSTVIEREHFLN
jgi:hypothetical protein